MRRLAPLVVIAAVAVLGYFWLGDRLEFSMLAEKHAALLAWRDANLPLAALIFVLGYIAIVAFSLPGAAVASLTGGFLFGLTLGTVLNVTGATIGATLIFLVVRFGLGAAIVERIDASDGKIKRIMTGLRENEISYLFLMRLVPAVPFFLANLLPALVGVKLRNFVLTTALGIVPGALVYTWVGSGLGAVIEAGGEPDLSIIWRREIILPILALCLLSAMPILIKRFRKSEVPQ